VTLPDRKYLFLAAGLLLGFAAGFLVGGEIAFQGGGSASGGTSGSSAGQPTLVPSDRPSRGPSDAPVTIVEFTDYECPYCRRYYRQTYHRLLEEFEGEVRYVVRNYPLSIHPNARKAAEAAECAHNQGRFWDYHDHLFENADALEPDDLRRHARDLGLDGGRPVYGAASRDPGHADLLRERPAAGGRPAARRLPLYDPAGARKLTPTTGSMGTGFTGWRPPPAAGTRWKREFSRSRALISFA